MTDTEEDVINKLTSNTMIDGNSLGFPKLNECGGFELCHSSANCKELEAMTCAYDAKS